MQMEASTIDMLDTSPQQQPLAGGRKTTLPFRPKSVQEPEVELPENVAEDARYEQVAAEAALARASTHYFGLWVPHYIFKVGAEKTEFLVLLTSLRLSCPSFEKRISNSVAECDGLTGGRVVELEHLPTSLFTIFVTWLHTGLLVPLGPSASSASNDDLERLVDGIEAGDTAADFVPDAELARLVTFAAAEDIPALKVTALAVLHSQNCQLSRTTTRGAIAHLYSSLTAGAAIQSYLADEASVFLHAVHISPRLWEFPDDYVYQALKVVFKERDLGTLPVDRMSKDAWSSRSVLFYLQDYSEEETESLADAIDKATIMLMPSSEIHDDYRSYVTVVVGFERLRFRVHKGLIQKYSDYCRGALRSGFLEAASNELDLRGETVCDFALFLDFLYEKEVYLPLPADHREYEDYSNNLKSDLDVWKQKSVSERLVQAVDQGSQTKGSTGVFESTYDTICRTQDMLVDLFIFSDRRGITQLRNTIINMLAEKRETGWPWLSASHELVNKAFSNLPPESALCRFLVDEAAWCWTTVFQKAITLESDDFDRFSDEFCAKVMKRWMQNGRGAKVESRRKSKSKPPPWREDICKGYHDHADEGEKTACREVAMKQWTKTMAAKTGMEPVSRTNLVA